MRAARGPGVGLKAEGEPGGIRIHVATPPRDVVASILCGPAWDGEDFFRDAYPGSSLVIPPNQWGKLPMQLTQVPVAASTETEAVIPVTQLPEGSSGLEIVARAAEAPETIVGRSPMFLVRREGDRVEVESHVARALREFGAKVVVLYLGAAAVLVALRFAPVRRLRTSWPGWLIVGGVLATLVVVRATGEEPTRVGVDVTGYDPPLLWPLSWSLDEDGWERSLGPGYRELGSAVRAEHRAGERLLLIVPEAGGIEFVRAQHLAAELPDAELFIAHDGFPAGLGVFFGVAADGPAVWSNDLAAIARTDGAERDPSR
ncbi:MAG TPA: hypothetical protein VKE69_07860 [Planctomycetota bacterium]|nr:hypothetical protein [Planctomycetota bacterium]